MNSASPHRNHEVVRRFVGFSRVAGLLMIAVALIMLMGWWRGWPLLMSAMLGEHIMKANVAIGFALSGSALLLSQKRSGTMHLAGRLLSLAVIGIGTATLGQYAWSIDLGIDHLFADPYSRQLEMPQERMPEPIAAALVLLGGQGLLVSIGRWLLLREGMAIGLLAIAMTGMSSYGFSLADNGHSQFEGVPIHTIVLLLVAALGWMSSVPTTGLTRVATADTLGGTFARYLLLPALLLPVAFAFVFEALQSWLDAPKAFAFAFAALFTGGTISWLIWWVAALLDKVERQRRESESLRGDASTDVLTGLPNRRAFDNALDNLLHELREHGTAFSLLVLDLDNFKAYNDDFGHQEGDEALRIAGRILRATLRSRDLAARYGGEEFALLLPGADAAEATTTVARILDAFRAFRWPHRTVTASIGIAEARAGDDAEDLIGRADCALYSAKRAGRNQATVAAGTSPVSARMHRRLCRTGASSDMNQGDAPSDMTSSLNA